MRLGLGGGYYVTGRNVRNECLNLYPEVIATVGQKRAQVQLVSTPGLVEFAQPSTAPVRAMLNVNGTLYVVSDQLYSVNTAGTITALGGIPAGEVDMAYNAAASVQIFIVVGTANCDFLDGYFTLTGTNIVSGWIYTVGGSLVQITDADFPTGNQGQSLWVSNLSDGTAWTATDFGDVESDPDQIVNHIVNHDEVIVFGDYTYEVYVNSPSGAGFPLAPRTGATQERGCLARNTVADMDNTIYFMGDDKIVYRINGYSPERISDHSIEAELDDVSNTEIDDASAFTYTHHGHFFYCLSAGTKTWVYDATASALAGAPMWHQRGSINKNKGNNPIETWRPTMGDFIFGENIFGSDEGKLFKIDFDTTTDDGDTITRRRSIGALTSPNGHSFGMSRVVLESSYVPDSSKVWLEHSRDGVNWGPMMERQLNQPTIWRALGPSRQHYLRWTITDNRNVTLYEAYGTLTDGGS